MTTVQTLKDIFNQNKDKCIAVVGTTCVGKTTLMKDISEAVAISDIAPPLTNTEREKVNNFPWTEKIGELMNSLKGQRAKIEAGKPAFGTVIPKNTELIIYLAINDDLLKERTEMRSVSFADAKAMQKWIERKVQESSLPVKIINITE